MRLHGLVSLLALTGALCACTTQPQKPKFTLGGVDAPSGTTGTQAGATGSTGNTGSTGSTGATGNTGPVSYTVGGTASGVAGALVLQLNGANNLTVTQDGPFVFPSPIADGTGYNVTVLTQPQTPAETCTVESGAGTLAGGAISSVAVTCTCGGCKSIYASGTCSAPAHQGTTCQSNNVYWTDACGVVEDEKTACAVSDVCTASGCCTPNCTGVCGGVSDGCGGTCNTCPANYDCQASTCVHCGNYLEPCCTSGSACFLGHTCSFGTCVIGSCASANDFTRCAVVTAPDRAYDICVTNTCVSPGCGTASCNAPRPSFPLADTSERLCYDANNPGNVIACPTGPSGTTALPCIGVTGSANLCGQDAQYGWDTQHAPAARFTVTSTTEPVVTDNVTGLIWQGGPGAPSTLTWDNALLYCDQLSWNGTGGWRLPDRYELDSITNYGAASGAAIDATAFAGTTTNGYWTNATVFSDSTSAYYGMPGMSSAAKTPTTLPVRCVQGGATAVSAPRFTINTTAGSVVSDAVTGLMWQRCAMGDATTNCNGTPTTVQWPAALAYCAELNWHGQTDWRLPNVMELQSLVSDRVAPTTIEDPIAFPAAPSGDFWSATTPGGSAFAAYSVSFFYAKSNGNMKTGFFNFYVRCVRSLP